MERVFIGIALDDGLKARAVELQRAHPLPGMRLNGLMTSSASWRSRPDLGGRVTIYPP